MSERISPALFRPPVFPYPYVPREGLLASFRNARPAKVILIEAAGGYGKSIGVAEFIHGLPAPSVWYPLEHLPVRTLVGFLTNLVWAVQSVWADFGARSTELLQTLAQIEAPLDDDAWLFAGLLPALTAELNALPDGAWIVLDNYHLLSRKGQFDQVLDYLVENTRAQIHLVVVSRERLNWSKRVFWQSQKILSVIDEGALAFSQKEALTLASKLGLSLPLDLFNEVAIRVNGQPFLHNLLMRNCRGKTPDQVRQILAALADPAQHVTDYLAQTYMQAESQEVRDFLWRTSLLKVLTPAICDALLDKHDSQEILQGLSGNMLIVLGGSGPNQTGYIHRHEIVREFLQRGLADGYGHAEIERLYKRLGDLHQDREEFDQAMENYCLGRQFREASRLVINQARYLVNTIQLPRLGAWLKLFPEEWLQNDAGLLTYLGVVQANAGNPLAIDTFFQAQQLFARAGDAEGVARALIELGWSYYVRSDYKPALKALNTALAEPRISPALRARGLHYLAMTLHGCDEFAQALEYANEAIQLLRQLKRREDHAALARLYRHLSQVHESIGQIQEALALNRESHELASALGLGDWAVAWMDYEWAENCLVSGRLDECRAHLDEADALMAPYRALNISSPLLDLLTAKRGELAVETYEYARAEAIFTTLPSQSLGSISMLKLVQPGTEVEALELAQENWRHLQSHNSPVLRSKAQARLGVALLGVLDTTHARAHLEEAAATLERHGAVHALMTVRFYLARLNALLDLPTVAQTHLRYVFAQMAERGYYGLLIWQPDVVAEMCALALRAGIEPDFVERLAIKRLTAAQVEYFSPLANDASETVGSRVQRILYELGGSGLARAREKLRSCKNEAVEKRLSGWLNSGWLTDVGLLRLEPVLSWRQIEVFLLWISPDSYGRTEHIAREMVVSVDTVNTHLKETRVLLAERLGAQFPKGKGAYMAGYDWAIRGGVVNPQAPR